MSEMRKEEENTGDHADERSAFGNKYLRRTERRKDGRIDATLLLLIEDDEREKRDAEESILRTCLAFTFIGYSYRKERRRVERMVIR